MGIMKKSATLSVEQFSKNFAPYPIPPTLEALLEFQNESNRWYRIAFELDKVPQERLVGHVKDEVLSQFFGFGRERDGSLYALWLYQGDSLEDAPIVYLNSEAEGSSVLASTLREFLTLLARNEEPTFGKFSEIPDAELELAPRNQEFRAWLEQKYDLRVAAHPNEVIQNARKHHPALPLAYEEE